MRASDLYEAPPAVGADGRAAPGFVDKFAQIGGGDVACTTHPMNQEVIVGPPFKGLHSQQTLKISGSDART